MSTDTATKTIDEIRAIEDPAERAREAGAYADAVRAEAKPHLARRNIAMLAAIAAGERKVDVYKGVGVSRSTLVKVEKSAPAEIPPIVAALDVAKEAQQALAPLNAKISEAVKVRDAAVLDMLYRRRMPNHEVVAATGLSSVRVAQLRADALG